MSLWWIMDSRARLVSVGRKVIKSDTNPFVTNIVGTGIPNPTRLRVDAKTYCREGETPVAVRLVKQSEYEALRDLALLSSHAKECSFFQSMRSGCDCGYTSARERLAGEK